VPDARAPQVVGIDQDHVPIEVFLRCHVALFIVVFAVAAAPAHAQGGINLAWNDCITQSNAAVNIQYACDGSRNGNPFRLVPSFIAPDDLHEFVRVLMVFDLTSDAGCSDCSPPIPPMTDWWRLGVGECRDGNLWIPGSLLGIGTGSTGDCRNPWSGANIGGGYQWTYLPSSPTRARLIAEMARETPTTLAQGQQYFSGVLTLDTFGDVAGQGIGVCAGCCEKRALVLQQVELYQTLPQVPPQQEVYILNTPGTRQHVFWQDSPALCATPTRRTTWGSIKTTYR